MWQALQNFKKLSKGTGLWQELRAQQRNHELDEALQEQWLFLQSRPDFVVERQYLQAELSTGNIPLSEAVQRLIEILMR